MYVVGVFDSVNINTVHVGYSISLMLKTVYVDVYNFILFKDAVRK
jgi:hypothetical protein